MAGVRGCQRRGDPVPRVGSAIGHSCLKLSWGKTTCVYATDNHSCFSHHGVCFLNEWVLRNALVLGVSRRLCWRSARFSRSTKLVLMVALVGSEAKSVAMPCTSPN